MSNPVAIVEALVTLAPAILAANTTTRARCILATRVGCEVLQKFEIPQAPLTVQVKVMNAACMAWVQAGQPGGVEEAKARGIHMIQIDERVEGPDWSGHLVIEVPGGFLDLDLQQFQRPEKAIDLPDAMAFGTVDAEGPWVYEVNGSWLQYSPRRTDTSFRRAPDWKRHRAGQHPLAGMLIRAIKQAGHDRD